LSPIFRHPSSAVHPRRSGRHLWLFRLAALILAPLLFLVLLEIGLRMGGYGYPSAATIPCAVDGVACRGDNVTFGWRFFPRNLAQEFDPFVFSVAKPSHLRRIFVLGESAAQGTPDCAYSFGRILEVMLDHAHPGTDFQVVTAAMPAINSHVVVEIAWDLARYEPDLFVIYMGNNEVVGPYGPGTVFSPLSANLSLIRAGIRMRTTRTGQLLADLASRLDANARSPNAWHGMEMFMGQRVPADDARLATVYRHFRRNLEDLGRIASGRGAQVLFCTLGCNLRDSPPFASVHREGLGQDKLAAWTSLYGKGTQREDAGDYSGAIESYQAAAEVDDRYADLQFRLGRCYWETGDYEKAGDRFLLARDLDALRFRPDRHMNEIIRDVASSAGDKHVHLVDVEKVFQADSPAGLPGRELLREHVHMTFHGDYVVARAVSEQVGRVLGMAQAGPPLGEAQCAERLGYNAWAHYNTMLKVLDYYLRKPPFTGQLYHDQQVRRLEGEVKQARAALTADVRRQIAAQYRTLIGQSPSDIWFRLRFAEFASVFLGDEQTVLDQCRHVQELMPHSYKPHMVLALSLGEVNRFEEAIEHLNKAVQLKPTCGQGYHMLGLAYQNLGRLDEAMRCYARAVRLRPDDAEAYQMMHDILLSQGRAEEAREMQRRAALAGSAEGGSQ
jgi:tetratricopeptide (TPR) repeat protein